MNLGNQRSTQAVGFLLLSIFLSHQATAMPIELIFEEFPQVGNTTFHLGYNNESDFINSVESSITATTNNFATGGDIAGWTYDGNQYHLLFEDFPENGNTTFLLSYNSLNDFYNSVEASIVATTNNFATGGDIAGWTYDGNQYHLVFEEFPGTGNTTFLLSYNSLNDFINSVEASITATTNNFATGGDIGGFGWDGDQYHLVFEEFPENGNTTFLLSYDSLNDFINSVEASIVATTNNFATGGDIAGFEVINEFNSNGGEIPIPTTPALILIGLVGIRISRTRRSIQPMNR